MEHSYKLLFVLRPLIWGLVAFLVGTFGKRFFKGLINAIAVFLFVISIGGCVLMASLLQNVLDPFNTPTTDDYIYCIVGTIMTMVFSVFSIAYFMMGTTIDTGDGKVSKHKEAIEKFWGYLVALILPICVMGFSVPFFLLEESAGKVVGTIFEAGGLLWCIATIKTFRRMDKKEERMKKYILSSERLLVRPILRKDKEGVHEYASDNDITMMLFLPNREIQETENFIEHAISEWYKENPDSMEYVIKHQGKVIGGIGIEYNETKDACEIGWVINKNYRNMGIATEAASMLVDFAFKNLPIKRVFARCDSRNGASEKVMINLGMKMIDASGTRTYPRTGEISGEYTYEITREEYFNNSNNSK